MKQRNKVKSAPTTRRLRASENDKPVTDRRSAAGGNLRVLGMVACLLAFTAQSARADTTAADSPGATNAAPPAMEADAGDGWSFTASAYTYFVPDDDDYVQPTFTADRGWLHLEARYNYEDLDTGSAWIGYNLSGGEELAWEFTPMLGGVFGDTDGIAPGYKGWLGWKGLEFYSEGEYVFDGHESSESFFYNWTELTFAPAEWCRFGLVTQHTRAYESDRDIQRGLLAAVSSERVDLAAYVLNPDDDHPTVVLAVTLSF